MTNVIRLARRLPVTTAVWGALLAAPAALAAQAKVELTPYFASFYALSTVNDDIFGDGSNIREKQFNAPTIGGRVTVWVSSTLGVEGQVGYAPSGTRFFSDTGSGGASSLNGTLLTASARALYRPARTNMYLLGGLGIVTRGGETWDFPGLDKLTSIGAVVGFGARASVTPKFSLTVSVEGFLYSSDPDGSSGTGYDSKFQQDLYVAIGVPIALAR